MFSSTDRRVISPSFATLTIVSALVLGIAVFIPDRAPAQGQEGETTSDTTVAVRLEQPTAHLEKMLNTLRDNPSLEETWSTPGERKRGDVYHRLTRVATASRSRTREAPEESAPGAEGAPDPVRLFSFRSGSPGNPLQTDPDVAPRSGSPRAYRMTGGDGRVVIGTGP